MTSIPRTARYVVRNQAETADDESTGEHHRIPQIPQHANFSLLLPCLTVSISCGIVYSRVKRTPESEKKKTYVYLIKREIKKKMLVHIRTRYVYA